MTGGQLAQCSGNLGPELADYLCAPARALHALGPRAFSKSWRRHGRDCTISGPERVGHRPTTRCWPEKPSVAAARLFTCFRPQSMQCPTHGHANMFCLAQLRSWCSHGFTKCCPPAVLNGDPALIQELQSLSSKFLLVRWQPLRTQTIPACIACNNAYTWCTITCDTHSNTRPCDTFLQN
jgi:hypothetical protein